MDFVGFVSYFALKDGIFLFYFLIDFGEVEFVVSHFFSDYFFVFFHFEEGFLSIEFDLAKEGFSHDGHGLLDFFDLALLSFGLEMELC